MLLVCVCACVLAVGVPAQVTGQIRVCVCCLCVCLPCSLVCAFALDALGFAVCVFVVGIIALPLHCDI